MKIKTRDGTQEAECRSAREVARTISERTGEEVDPEGFARLVVQWSRAWDTTRYMQREVVGGIPLPIVYLNSFTADSVLLPKRLEEYWVERYDRMCADKVLAALKRDG